MPGGGTIPYILATAGHVDHGKSALVKALTGSDPDRLPEEKARGLTIELGFASFRLPSPPGIAPAAEYQIGVIDVPGHEDFVRNMVAGVGSIDAALLVVAADDGWMPQTQEHFQILSHLGVTRGIVVVSKIDLAADEPVSLRAIKDRLRGTCFEHAPIVPTSVLSARGIEPLKLAIAGMLACAPPQSDVGKPRLSVDRAFIMKGVGTIVTGTLTGGTLRRGQAVIIQPAQTSARIRAIQSYGREVQIALPGSRVALNLPDLHPAAPRGVRAANSIARGDVVTIPSLAGRASYLDVQVKLDRGIKDHSPVQIHHGTAAVRARIRFLESASARLARLTFDDRIFALAGDRFIVRDGSERWTLGGGIVLDAHPPAAIPRRSPVRSRQVALLEARGASPDDPTVFVATQVQRDRVTPRHALPQSSRLSVDQIGAAVSRLAGDGSLVAWSDWLVQPAVLAELRERVAGAVDAHHRSHPEQMGLPLAEVKAMVDASGYRDSETVAAILLDAMISELSRSGFERTGTILRRAAHRPALPPRLQSAGQTLRRQLADHLLDLPSRKQLCPNDLSHQALQFLIATGQAVQLNPDLVLDAEVYRQAIESIRARLQSGSPATVSELKTLLGTSRRVMVPLLEKLDREGMTVRDGDRRRLSATWDNET